MALGQLHASAPVVIAARLEDITGATYPFFANVTSRIGELSHPLTTLSRPKPGPVPEAGQTMCAPAVEAPAGSCEQRPASFRVTNDRPVPTAGLRDGATSGRGPVESTGRRSRSASRALVCQRAVRAIATVRRPACPEGRTPSCGRDAIGDPDAARGCHVQLSLPGSGAGVCVIRRLGGRSASAQQGSEQTGVVTEPWRGE